MDALGKLIDLTAAVIIMMIIPILWANGMHERIVMKHAEYLADDFVEDVCHHGSVSKERYEAFLNSLSASSQGFIVDMECQSVICEPVYDNGVFTGRTVDVGSVCFMEDILGAVYRSGYCGFVEGAHFYVTVRHGGTESKSGGVVSGDPDDI